MSKVKGKEFLLWERNETDRLRKGTKVRVDFIKGRGFKFTQRRRYTRHRRTLEKRKL